MLPLVLKSVCYDVGGRRVLDALSVELTAGLRTIVLGPNGAGKSILLRLCHGLLQPSAGSICWMGACDGRPSSQAMVFQRPVMLRRSVLANITYALAVRGVPRTLRAARAREALHKVGLERIADSSARVLSGGEQQRVALARAWALAPAVLFLDEPTANLDPAATREIERVIGAIASSGTKIVMTTHDLGQARRLADEVLFLCDGRLLERARAGDFFERPAAPEAAAFLRGELPWH